MSYHAHLRRIKRIERAARRTYRTSNVFHWSDTLNERIAREDRLIKLAWQQWNASRQKHSETYKEGL